LSEIYEKTKDFCIVCGEGPAGRFDVSATRYWRCEACGSVFMDPTAYLGDEGEKSRYLRHENSLQEPGYRGYLGAFLDGILAFEGIEPNGIERVFDYGSGPTPALVELLRLRGFQASGWDPFFDPRGKSFEGGADLVTCLEVAEHFQNPMKGFCGLAQNARPGGWIAVATHVVNPDRQTLARDFPAWWYRQDPTHVVFYTKNGLILVGERAGLRYAGQAGAYTYLFQRDRIQ